MIKDDLTLKGRLEIVVTSEDGAVKQRESVDNLVVTTGKNFSISHGGHVSERHVSHGDRYWHYCRQQETQPWI